MKFTTIFAAFSTLAVVSAMPCHSEEPCESEVPAPCASETPLQAAPVSGNECEHGEFRCTETSSDRCNWGVWVASPCVEGTRCVWGDFECVMDYDYERLNSIFNPAPTSSVYMAPVPEPTVTPTPGNECEHGAFRCTDVSTDRCNWGQWVAYPCVDGTHCVPFGDYECVPLDQWQRVSELVQSASLAHAAAHAQATYSA